MTESSVLERRIETKYKNYNDLSPINEFNLTDKQNDFLKKLEFFEAPYLEEKLLSDEKFKTREEYQEAFTEFKKYIVLSEICRDDITMTMTSKKVDEVWHQFILFTPQYHKFCKEMLGRYFHHIPKTSLTPLDPKGKENFIESYKEIFGELPEIWGANSGCAFCRGEGCLTCEESK